MCLRILIQMTKHKELGKLLDFKEKKKKILLFRSKEHMTYKKKKIGFLSQVLTPVLYAKKKNGIT